MKLNFYFGRRILHLWPYWGVLGLAAGLLTFAHYYNGPTSDIQAAPRIMAKKMEVLAALRINLLKSVEAEKHAVMADTDEASVAFAAESRRASEAVEKSREELSKLIDLHSADDESKWLQEFNECWDQIRMVERMILDLAVQNTNLKAARLSFGKGQEDVERFEKALSGLTQNLENAQALRSAADALSAELKILTLHAPHIASPDDEEMSRIEHVIHEKDLLVRRSLDQIVRWVPADNQDALIQARQAHNDFMAITQAVIGLSRQNTNVTSFGISLDKKRKITAHCETVLTRLDESFKRQVFRATR